MDRFWPEQSKSVPLSIRQRLHQRRRRNGKQSSALPERRYKVTAHNCSGALGPPILFFFSRFHSSAQIGDEMLVLALARFLVGLTKKR